ncbi:MAG: hypothetical protein HWD61_06125 [Parachlamydiaceae bacterium]|nr:MAG: hypothetical protein HWD61_06125 [Parachlamydiaceae bacterium]
MLKKFEKAIKYFEEAVNNGCEEAAFQLGCLYDEGVEVEKMKGLQSVIFKSSQSPGSAFSSCIDLS